jgi:TetR/AcrR family transcriptional repressor of mexJK operon
MMALGQADDPLRKLFWEAGPQRTHDAFAAFLQSRVEAGELQIPDVSRAAEQFFSLIKGEMHGRMICGLCARPPRGDVAAHIEATVDMFLRAYAVR